MRVCKYCGKEYDRRNEFYCSRTCRNKAITRKHMEEEPKFEKTCEVCGEVFLAKRSNRKYCSDKCNWKAQHKRRKQRYPIELSNSHVWRATREKVYDDQDGKCWLCGKALGKLWDAHHEHYQDYEANSLDVVGLCKSCHNKVHRITVCWVSGRLTFHGEALNMLKEKGYE